MNHAYIEKDGFSLMHIIFWNTIFYDYVTNFCDNGVIL